MKNKKKVVADKTTKPVKNQKLLSDASNANGLKGKVCHGKDGHDSNYKKRDKNPGNPKRD